MKLLFLSCSRVENSVKSAMFIYDSTSIAFIQKAEAFLKEILTKANIQIKRSRFLWGGYFYPIHVVVFEGKEWGHFNAPYFQIGLNRKLIYLAKDSVVRDILKHELAHYFTHILYKDAKPHGKEFREVCQRFDFPEDVSRATMDLDASNSAKEGDIEAERILEKVKKLFMLAQSSNAHEAELATVKANELLLRHNLNYLKEKDEPIYLDRLLQRKRKDSKLSSIYGILKHFIVRPVISQGKDSCCLEVSGSYTNVRLAGYVASFLDRELDHLWELVKLEHGFKGIRAKNSFFHGVAEGFNQKMLAAKSTFSETDKKALIVVEKKLDLDTQFIYKRLGQSRSDQQTDLAASRAGHQKGLSLTIRNAVEGKAKSLYLTEH
jgi:hypothetical protein